MVLLCLLLVFEILLHFQRGEKLEKIYYPEIRENHPTLGFTHKPNSIFHLRSIEWDSEVKTNQLGFRDREHSLKKIRRYI